MMSSFRFLSIRILFASTLLTALACAPAPRERILPGYIQSVWIPTVENKSYEIGIEEDATRALQEAFLRDGRLTVARERDASLVIETTITDFKVQPVSFEDDRFPSRSEVQILADVTAYDPLDFDRQWPQGTWEEVEVNYGFLSNTRLQIHEIDIDAKRKALESLADEIVTRVITEEPDDLEDLMARREEAWENSPEQQRRARFRSAYSSNPAPAH